MTTSVFPEVSVEVWRGLVEKELAGKDFDKVLVQRTLDGLTLQPLYTERPSRAAAVPPRVGRTTLCVCLPPRRAEAEPASFVEALRREREGGADALWLAFADRALLPSFEVAPKLLFSVDQSGASAIAATAEIVRVGENLPATAFDLALDPLAAVARGELSSAVLPEALAATALVAEALAQRAPGAHAVLVSSLPFHEAGADAATELALVLSSYVRLLGALTDGDRLSLAQAAQTIAVQVSLGQNTFVELCKLRALRVCLAKVLHASGLHEEIVPRIHGVCSSRTLSIRDPWVNMLRATTQLFAGLVGGADWLSPRPFDEGFAYAQNEAPSDLGLRVARNTVHVLRDESALDQVSDPAAGSYAFETLTDELARAAWAELQRVEAAGGIEALLADDATSLRGRLEESWTKRLDALSKRRAPVLGVSEFAHLDEMLPGDARQPAARERERGAITRGLFRHRDAEPFERLREVADGLERGDPRRTVLLATLGSFAASRARVGFASGLFAAGGLRTRESTDPLAAFSSGELPIPACVCLAGPDDQYELEAVRLVGALKQAGVPRVFLAGRPSATLAEPLRAAGLDGAIFVGCDALSVLSSLLLGST
jgi:methylmalonyl-CoA mutase